MTTNEMTPEQLEKAIDEKRGVLSKLVAQASNQESLIETLEHREHSARDLLKLKRDGIGFPGELSCPTCQKTIEPKNFNLISQDVSSIEMYLSALQKERTLLRQNIQNTKIEIVRIEQWLTDAKTLLRAKEREIDAINSSISSQKQAIVSVTAKLAETERKIEKAIDEIEELEKKTTPGNWVTDFINVMVGDSGLVWDHANELEPFKNKNDLKFIVDCHNLLPHLIKAWREMSDLLSTRKTLLCAYEKNIAAIEARFKAQLSQKDAVIEKMREFIESVSQCTSDSLDYPFFMSKVGQARQCLTEINITEKKDCLHFWTRRRDGLVCNQCGVIQFGVKGE